jgi:minor extracellular serine protease Vpr
MRRSLVAVAAAVLAATAIGYAQNTDQISAADNESASLWFVELSTAPTVEGTSTAALDREEADFHSAAGAAGIRYSETRHFRDLFNGLTVRASDKEAARLRSVGGVAAVYPVVKMSVAQDQDQSGNELDLITALKMTGADIAQNDLHLTGRGVKVAVIDTGIDYDHPDLGGCFGPGCRVMAGFDLVGDAFNADDATPIITPDPFPDDCAGHGTHVAGIVGANGGIKGVAPDVRFLAYRVFGCDGTTTSDIMLAAMEMALHDHADVVNMSIGAARQWPQYPTATAANRLVKHGVVVVVSIGNEATQGLYGAAAPGVGKDVIGVASFDNTFANLVAFTISPDNQKVGYIEASGAPAAPTSGTFPMARTGTTTTVDDACTASPTKPAAGSLTGKIALIRRGTCSFYEKSFNAQSAGAIGVVLYNNATGFISPTVAGTPAITIPVVAITAAQGSVINGRIAGGGVNLTWTTLITSEPNPTANLISSFSSWGPAYDLSFKPDIGAPGGTIRSTLPLEQGGYGNLSGTSMASPHVAGAAALMLQANPRLSPAAVQTRMQNNAKPHLWSGNPSLGFLDLVHRQGAGMLDIVDAIEADDTVEPSSLAVGEIEAGNTASRWLRVRRPDDRHDRWGWCRRHNKHHGPDDDDDPITYTLSHVPALATGANTFTPTFFASFATVTFSAPTVTVGGHHAEWGDFVKVTITPPGAASSARVFGGYIVLTPDDDDAPTLRVPYTGYNGDYQLIPVLTGTTFPLLASLNQTTGALTPLPAGGTFTLQNGDIPFFLVHFDHGVTTLKLEVFDVATGKSLNFADDENWVPRNSTATSFFAIPWDGTTVKRPNGRAKAVPNGTYRVELSILKALGDPRNPAHFERRTFPNVVIARP